MWREILYGMVMAVLAPVIVFLGVLFVVYHLLRRKDIEPWDSCTEWDEYGIGSK